MNLKQVFGDAFPFVCAIIRFLLRWPQWHHSVSRFGVPVWNDSGLVIIHWAGAIYPSLKEDVG